MMLRKSKALENMKTLEKRPDGMLLLSIFDGFGWERISFKDMDELNLFLWERYRDIWTPP